MVEEIFDGEEINIYGEMRSGVFNLFSAIKKVNYERNNSLTWDKSYLINLENLECCEKLTKAINTTANSINFKDGFLGCGVLKSKNKFNILEIVPMLGLDHILLSDNFGAQEISEKFILKKPQFTFKALKSIWDDEINSTDKIIIDNFNRDHGVTTLYRLPYKKEYSYEGNGKIRGFLMAASNKIDSINTLFNETLKR